MKELTVRELLKKLINNDYSLDVKITVYDKATDTYMVIDRWIMDSEEFCIDVQRTL